LNSKMKIVRIENQHDDFEEDSVFVHCWKEKFDIQELILICFELRTLFDLKIKNDKTLLFIFKRKARNKISNAKHYYIYAWRNKISNAKYCYIFEKNKTSKCRNVIISFEESTVNESRLSNACNRAHNYQNDDFEIIKKKEEHFFENVNSMY
jgi:hypothetical protein